MKNRFSNWVFFSILLVFSFFPLRVYAGERRVSLESYINLLEKGGIPQKHISWAKYRIAIFAFEDPESTGLGDNIATLLSQEILFNSGIASLAVITFTNDLSSDAPNALSYFDIVEKITESEKVFFSIWGRILPMQDTLVIDVFLQLPRETLENHFYWVLRLPRSMGGGSLQAHLRPDRIHLQNLRLDKSVKSEIMSAAAYLNTLRQSPNFDAEIIGNIPQQTTYRTIQWEKDWVKIKVESGSEGWMPITGHCTGSCRPLLEAGQFAGGIIRYAVKGIKELRNATDYLTVEALAVEEQIKALNALNEISPDLIKRNSLNRALRWVGPNRWTGKDKWTQIDRGQGIPPGGAAFANIKIISEVAIKLREALEERGYYIRERYREEYYRKLAQDIFDRYCGLSKSFVEEVTTELAKASLNDPDNIDVLKNLVVLFDFLNDFHRKKIAESLVLEITNQQKSN